MHLGLTGGIGCGKSLVLRLWEEAGARCLDTDRLVRDLLEHDEPTRAALRATFGRTIFTPDERVDRHALAARVFPEPAALAALEAILHPRVRARWQAALAAAPADWWVVEIPLLFEKRLETHFDFTLCVAASALQQRLRLKARGLSEDQMAARIARQFPLSDKILRADFVLYNNGSVDFARLQVRHLQQQLRRLS